MFRVEFATVNAAFAENGSEEVEQILVKIGRKLMSGLVEGTILDSNGNSVGKFGEGRKGQVKGVRAGWKAAGLPRKDGELSGGQKKAMERANYEAVAPLYDFKRALNGVQAMGFGDPEEEAESYAPIAYVWGEQLGLKKPKLDQDLLEEMAKNAEIKAGRVEVESAEIDL